MRDRGVETQYTLTTVLLDYLRAAFDPEHEAREFDARWQALIDIPVLCIDELDEYTATDWATIRFKMLLDFRWRIWQQDNGLCRQPEGQGRRWSRPGCRRRW
ncbi:MAG: hypothetical protein KIT77_25165 [Caldilinea sp.]|nr:hypothetical protein [Caldilinea sp.]